MAPNLAYNKNKLYKTLDNWFRDMLNFICLEKGLELVPFSHLCIIFQEKYFSCTFC